MIPRLWADAVADPPTLNVRIKPAFNASGPPFSQNKCFRSHHCQINDISCSVLKALVKRLLEAFTVTAVCDLDQ